MSNTSKIYYHDEDDEFSHEPPEKINELIKEWEKTINHLKRGTATHEQPKPKKTDGAMGDFFTFMNADY